MKFRTLSAAILWIAVFSCISWGRTWTSQDGNFTLDAELVAVKQGKVFLKKNDGTVIGVPLVKLSKEDQQFLKEEQETPAGQKEGGEKKVIKPTASVDEALKTKVSYAFVDTPLANVLDFFDKVVDVNIYINRRALDEIAVSVDSPVTASAEQLALGSALKEILKTKELAYVKHSEVLVVTSIENSEQMLSTKAYQVLRRVAPDDLIEEITGLFAPNSWSDVGGPATLQPTSTGILIISQQDEVHEQIADHYKDLLRPLALPEKPRAAPKRGRVSVESALEQITSVEFLDTPLRDAVAFLEDQHGVRITIDTKSLEDEGLGIDTPVSIRLRGVSLQTALDLMLGSFSLTWVGDKDKLEVTTWSGAESRMIPVTYPMRDVAGASDLREWEEVVTSTIAPASWDEVGGPGTVKPTRRGTLEILQTFQVHRQIAELFKAISTAKQR